MFDSQKFVKNVSRIGRFVIWSNFVVKW